MKRIQETLPYIGIYIGVFVLFTAIYLGLFYSSVFSFEHVLFYRGLLYLLLTSLGIFAGILLVSMRLKYRYLESMISALVLAASIHLNVFVVFPVTFERSISMYLLTTLEKNRTTACGGLTKEQMKEGLINTFVVEKDALQKRIIEQSIINMIEGKNNCYMVTDQAVRFLHFSTFIKALYNIK